MLNKVFLVGNAGKDAELRRFPDGGVVTNVSLATSRRWKNEEGELLEHTEWHRLSFFGRTAENAYSFIKKGTQIHAEGELRTNKYTDKDGVERYSTEIRCEQFLLLGRKDSASNDASQSDEAQEPTPRKGAGAPAGGGA